MSNLLFGKSSDPNTLGRSNETGQMLSARMKSSSKLNLRDSDIKDFDDPFKFKHFYYPQEVGQLGDGHYMKFEIFTNTKSGITEKEGGITFAGAEDTAAGLLIEEAKQQFDTLSGKAIEGTKNFLKRDFSEDIDGIKNLVNFSKQPSQADIDNYKKLFKSGPRDKFSSTHRRLDQAIVLYTAPETKFGYKAEYENADTGILGGIFGEGNFVDVAGSLSIAALSNLVLSALEMVSPGVKGLAGRFTGMAINPNMELAFKSVPFRDFSYNFKFAPKNEKELEETHKIIEAFKFHMLPSMTQDEQFFISPSQFQITYMYRGNNNSYIPRISKCVLTDMEINYAPGEKFTTLKPDDQGASPQIIDMQLQFKEMAIITKESTVAGF
tara:strand:- start:128 stop:1270 length:1143 start_codon:yes stop_codon:yes gene_type:complete